jgi:hypothetical protein
MPATSAAPRASGNANFAIRFESILILSKIYLDGYCARRTADVQTPTAEARQ